MLSTGDTAAVVDLGMFERGKGCSFDVRMYRRCWTIGHAPRYLPEGWSVTGRVREALFEGVMTVMGTRKTTVEPAGLVTASVLELRGRSW